MNQIRLDPDAKQLLAELYERTRRTVDELPYTDEFERLFESFLGRTGLNLSRNQVWRALASQRKASRLERKKRGTPSENPS